MNRDALPRWCRALAGVVRMRACPFDLGGPFRRRRSPMEPIHALVRGSLFRQFGPVWSPVLRVAAALFWPWRSVELAARVTRDVFASDCPPAPFVNRWRAFAQCWSLCFWANVAPYAFYALELHRSRDARRAARDYLMNHEAAPLARATTPEPRNGPIDDKQLFHDYCRARRIPTPAILARYRGGDRIEGSLDGHVARLVVKPVRGSKGEMVRILGDATFEAPDDSAGPGPDETLDETLRRLSAHQDLIVQPCLEAGRGWVALSGGLPPILRVITARVDDAEPQLLLTVLRWPRAGEATSNGGLSACVDHETGRLGRAVCLCAGCTGHAVCPDTQEVIEGRAVPEWPAAAALARALHAGLQYPHFVGWDIALTGEGPIALEGNHAWGALDPQRACGVPLGRTRFPDLVRLSLAAKAP